MRNEKRTTEHPDYRDPWDRGTYQTGFTEPPRNHNALIAILLVLVIFLAGIVSILGFLNVKLFAELKEQKKESVSLSVQDGTEANTDPHPESSVSSGGKPDLGIDGEAVVSFYQRYYRLPEGMFITDVQPDSNAAVNGLKEGDILISLDGTKITDMESLEDFLSTCQVGDSIQATIYRSHQQLTLELTVEDAEE